ncbi:hypothetical protein J5U18_09845 [Sphingobacteriaceae bacterium WQ 2009]|uniref:JAB domain-containing protein n=1 Tax=Rhinopithecimicrobium faecis TaxID=2820698 RepID=A0A8T4HAS5_9SPHI|nr:hypothetical protein [Sphingobacteriaceae bacterium WQ 2009]
MWDQAREGKDSSLLVPIHLTLIKDSIVRTADGAPLNGNIWLYAKKKDDNWSFTMWTLIPTNSDKTKFTGTLLSEDYFQGIVSYSNYINGEIIQNKEIIKKQNIAKREKLAITPGHKMAGGWSYDCNERIYTICVGNPRDPSDSDICNIQYETTCKWNWTNPGLGDNQERIDWIDCSDGGCGGGLPNEEKPDSTLKEIPDKDPCKGKKAVNERLNKEKIKVMNKTALTNTHNQKIKVDNRDHKVEWGYETKFATKGSRDMITSPIRNGQRSSFIPEKTWDSTYGYVIGVTHTHPQNSPPSASDIFRFSQWINQIPNGDQDLFATYFTSTIITNSSVYVITIKDKDQFKKLLTNKTEQQLKDEYVNKAKNYQEEILKSSDPWAQRESQEYALLKIFGASVTIYKSKNQENLDFKPLVFNNTNKPIVKSDCQD